jgi:hypothetical protein
VEGLDQRALVDAAARHLGVLREVDSDGGVGDSYRVGWHVLTDSKAVPKGLGPVSMWYRVSETKVPVNVELPWDTAMFVLTCMPYSARVKISNCLELPLAHAILHTLPLSAEGRSRKMIAALDNDDPDDNGTDGWGWDPEARIYLRVLADELESKGDPRGEWLALVLAEAPPELVSSALIARMPTMLEWVQGLPASSGVVSGS